MDVSALSHKWLQALAVVSLDALYIVEPIGSPIPEDFRLVFVNDIGAQLFGKQRHEIVDKLLSEFVPNYAETFRIDLLEVVARGEVVTRETTVIPPEIALTKVNYRMVPFDGLIAISALNRTSELTAEMETQAVRRILAAQIDTSLTASALIRPIFNQSGKCEDLLFEQANSLVADLLGLTTKELIGARMYEVLPRRTGELLALVAKCCKSGQMISLDYDARQSALNAEWVRLQLSPVGDFVVMHAEDISEQHREEPFLRAIVEEAAEIIVLADRSGLMRYANPHTLVALGYKPSELIGRAMVEFCAPDDRAAMIANYLHLRAGHSSVLRHRIDMLHRNGEIRTTVGSSSALFTPTGEFDGVVVVTTDITDRLASEEARAQLAAALSVAEQRERERLAGDLHDGPVQRLASLSMQLGAGASRSSADIRALLARSENEVVQSISELRSLMFELSPPDLEGIGLVHAIRGRAAMLFEGEPTRVEVLSTLHVVPSVPLAITLFRLVQEALVNTRKHARASKVNVRISRIVNPIESGLVANEFVVVEIEDDGCGALPEAFERFRPGHIGISTMHDRARQLGGSCEIASNLEIGTTVKIVIPLTV
jgi:PAS domain S-box-containing protein